MFPWRARAVLALSLAAAALGTAAAPAGAAWPNDKPIEIVVGYQAGSGPDILARRMAPVIGKHLGSNPTFVITNRPGASGEIALTAVSRAAPDGYTLGTLSTPSFITMAFSRKPQYDPAAIALLARVVDDPTIIVVGAKSPYKTLGDIAAALRAKAGSVSMGHNGIGTNGHLAVLAFRAATGAKLNDIPFKGSSESRTALLGGHVDAVGMSVSEFLLDKEVVDLFRPIAQLGKTRAPALPDVPTAAEQGFDIVVSSERGFMAPRGLPVEVMERLEKAIAAAATDPDFLRGDTKEQLGISYLTGAQWLESIASRRQRYEAIWKAAEETR